MIRFLAWLSLNTKDGIGETTAKNKVYAIREYAYQEYGDQIHVDHKSAPILGRFRKSLGKAKPATGGSDAVTLWDCYKMIQVIQNDQTIEAWEKQTQQTLISLAFSEIKRAGEYLSDSKTGRGLHYKDMKWRINAMTGKPYIIWLRLTGKTHQQNTPRDPLESTIVCKCKKWREIMCPYHNVMKIVKIQTETQGLPKPSDPILIRKAPKTAKKYPYNEYTAGRSLKRLAKEAGLITDAAKEAVYTLHGFRKGGAIQAVLDGNDDSTIMKQADWNSARMIQHYQNKTPIDIHALKMIRNYS